MLCRRPPFLARTPSGNPARKQATDASNQTNPKPAPARAFDTQARISANLRAHRHIHEGRGVCLRGLTAQTVYVQCAYERARARGDERAEPTGVLPQQLRRLQSRINPPSVPQKCAPWARARARACGGVLRFVAYSEVRDASSGHASMRAGLHML